MSGELHSNDEISDKVKVLCGHGYEYFDQGDFDNALRLFYQAWITLPSPQTDRVESGWVLTAIGDAYFKSGKHEQAINALESALHCRGIDDNPFIYLRLGQSLLDTEQLSKARKLLLKAYQHGGAKLFEKEPKKYLASIRDLIG